MNKYRIIILIAALILAIVNILSLDFDNITNFKANQSQYVGIFSMILVSLSMIFSIKYPNKEK